MAINNPQSDTVTMIDSSPPIGKCKVINLFVDPETGRLVVEYDDGIIVEV